MKKKITLEQNLSKNNFAENDFRSLADQLSLAFKNDQNIISYKYLGIDPYPIKDNDQVRTVFTFEVEYND